MTRENQAILIGLPAGLLLRLGLTDDLLAFVKPSMRPWLLISGVVLAALTIGRLFVGRRGEDADHVHATVSEPDHDHGSRLAWLLLLPFLAVFVVDPRPLGAFAASRQSTRAPDPPAGVTYAYPPLDPPVDGAHELSLTDFVNRAHYDDRHHMADATIRLRGFVVPAPGEPGRFLLTRFALSCCAADGYPVQVLVDADGQQIPPPDTWLAVEGTWSPDPSGREPDVPRLSMRSLVTIDPPADPYE